MVFDPACSTISRTFRIAFDAVHDIRVFSSFLSRLLLCFFLLFSFFPSFFVWIGCESCVGFPIERTSKEESYSTSLFHLDLVCLLDSGWKSSDRTDWFTFQKKIIIPGETKSFPTNGAVFRLINQRKLIKSSSNQSSNQKSATQQASRLPRPSSSLKPQ